MTYDEIISYPRKWDRAAYPIVAHIEIDAEKFSRFERLIDDQTQTRMLGHDLVSADRIVVHVACANERVKQSLENRWG